MKKIIFSVVVLTMCLSINAQSEKYFKLMEKLVGGLDTTIDINQLATLSNSFERIANAEKTEWLPYYYAALTKTKQAMMLVRNKQGNKADEILELTDSLIQKTKSLTSENVEIFILVKMYHSAKMMVNPMQRYMVEGTAAAEALASAKKLDPENPRIFLLEGQDKYFTPEQYGGSKVKAKELFEHAQKIYNVIKPMNSIVPQWGRTQLTYMQNLKE